jgi:hypothetical protein
MTAVANDRAGDNLLLLPPRELPYVLQEVCELVRDGCRSEIVLQWSEGHLLFRADENTDSLDFEFHPGEFVPSPDHCSFSPSKSLSGREREVLKELAEGPKTKQQLGAPARLLGAATREDFGKQGGGLLERDLIRATGKRVKRSLQYEITPAGRNALAVASWKELLGKECGWTWVAINQQGYCDGVMLSFDGIVPTVLLHVIASSIEVFSIRSG